MPVTPPPRAEVEVDEALVRAMLREQHADLADLPLELVASGWDNAMWRLGDDLAVRVPRRAVAVPLIEHEQRWLPVVAAELPLPAPIPLRRGVPGATFPWPWTVCPWIAGGPAAEVPPHDPMVAAQVLGDLLAALHRPAPPDRWIHGDLHPLNLLVRDGELAGVVDFGDLAAGDPATDLAIAWMLLPSAAHHRLRERLDPAEAGEATWCRARGWATALGLAYLAHSEGLPAMARVGRATLAAVVADPTRP